MHPTVSIVTSVYNGGDHLRESIESILAQTFTDLELVIINDGSTDDTQEVIESFDDARIRAYHQENIGLTRSLNRALKLSIGKYIARIDSDEISMPNRLARQVDFLDSNPEIGLVGSFCLNYHNGLDNAPKKVITPVSNEKIRKKLLKTNPIVHGSVMVRREVFDKVGFYNEDFKYVQDYELWGRIAEFCKLHNLPEFLLKRKITDNCLSNNKKLLKIRARLTLKAQYRIIRNMQCPIYSYFLFLPNICLFLLYYFNIARFPIREKKDLLKIFTKS